MQAKITITIQITRSQKDWIAVKKKAGISQNMIIQNALHIAMKADNYAIAITNTTIAGAADAV